MKNACLFGILFFAGLGIWSCNLSESKKSDTLTFHLDDSLKAVNGKYDSVELDLYLISGKDTSFKRMLFRGKYVEVSQLENLNLGGDISGNFIIRVIGYRNHRKVFEIGVPFTDGHADENRIVYTTTQPVIHAPTFVSGLENVSMREGESRRVVIKAEDKDGDPIQFVIQNLDSLRALFLEGVDAIAISVSGDSLILNFSPGLVSGNFRFRIALMDPSTSPEVQVLTISVGKVNRPPAISVATPNSGPAFLIQEGKTLSLRLVVQDPDSGTGAAFLPLQNPPWSGCGQGGFDTVSGDFHFTPSFKCVISGESTLASLIFRARDNGIPPETSEYSVRLTVKDSNSAPKWKSTSVNLAGKEGMEMSQDLSLLYLGDDEKDSVEVSSTCGTVDWASRTWSFVPGFRDAGQKECQVTAHDSHIPPAGTSLTLKLAISDSIRLVDVAITSPIQGFISKDSLLSVRWAVGDQPQNLDTTETLKTEGRNIVRRSFTDSLGNSGSDSIVVYLDTKPPSKPGVSVNPASTTNNRRPKWSWVSGGHGIQVYRFGIDDEAAVARAGETLDTVYTPSQSLPHGPHTLYVQERDSAGNWSLSGSAMVWIDTISPAAPKMDSTPLSPVNSLRPTWTWRSGGGGAKVFRCKVNDPNLNGAGEQSDSTFTPNTGLLEGRHVLYVQEKDSAGNWSAVARRELVLAIRGVVGSAGFSDEASNSSITLAIDNSGEKYVVYTVMLDTILSTRVKKYNGSFWQNFGDLSQYGNLGGSFGMAFNSSNVPHVCLNDSGGRATVVRYQNGTWAPLGDRCFTQADAGEAALKFAPDGTLYAVFRDEARGNKATVMRFVEGKWEIAGNPEISTGFALFFSIAISSKSVPYIAYLDADGEYGQPVIRKLNSSATLWEKVESPKIHSPGADFFNIAMNAQDSLFLAIPASESNGEGLAFRFNGAGWENIGSPIFEKDEGYFLTMAIDSFGKKFAAYQDHWIGGRVTIKALMGYDWLELPTQGHLNSASGISPVVLSPDGVPHIAIADQEHGGKITVYKASFDP